MPKVWLITGSSRGLGRSIAELALAAGDQVLASTRTPEHLQEMVDRYGDQIRTVQRDVTRPSAARQAVQTAVAAFDRIDVVVNAARSAEPAVEDFSTETIRVPMETNLFGFAYLIEAVWPVLRRQGSGHIIEIPPAGSRIPSLGLSAYHISKDAVEEFTVELAHEIAPYGIRVTIVETSARDFHSNRSESFVPVLGERDSESIASPPQRAHTHNSHGPDDTGRIARLILSIAGTAEAPLRVLAGSGASQYQAWPA